MSSFQALHSQRAARQKSHHVTGSSIQQPRAVDGSPVAGPSSSQALLATSSTSSMKEERQAKASISTRSASTANEVAVTENSIFNFAKFGVRAEKRTGRGRGVFASKAFRPGDIIYSIETRPPAAVLSSPNLSTHCSACFLSARDAAIIRSTEETPLKRCSACRVVHYCSVACSKVDWVHHKPECTAFQTLRKRYKEKNPDMKAGSLEFLPYESVRALGRLLWAKKRAKDAGHECKAWDEYAMLQSQIDPEADKLEKLRHEAYRLAFYVGLTSLQLLEAGGEAGLALLMKEYGIEGNPELEMMKIWSRYQTNAFTLDSPDLSALGVVVAPGLAMANHSCEPNAVVVFPKGEGKGQITAIRPVEKDEEILVCYIDVASPYSVRQADLSARYNFQCDCNLCTRDSREGWIDVRWCLSHPRCRITGEGRGKGKATMPDTLRWESLAGIAPIPSQSFIAPSKSKRSSITTKCQLCEETFQVDEALLRHCLERAKGLLQADEKGSLDAIGVDHLRIAQDAQMVVTSLLNFCPPSSHPLIPLNRLVTRLLTINPPTSLQTLQAPLHHLTLALEGARQIYAPHHPTLAILLAQKARLLGIQFPLTEQEIQQGKEPADVRNDIQRMQAAVVAYREAITACSGCFGTDGGIVGLGSRRELESLEAEMAAMRVGFASARPG